MATSIETTLDSQLDRFFKQEVIDSHRQERTVQGNQCEAHFISTFQRTTSGRFCIKLPFSSPVNSLGDSKLMAKRRFLSLEKRLEHNCNLKSEYVEFMDDYKSRGHMSPVVETEVTTPNYFLPHHCVLIPDSSSTRLRVVFDASAQTTSGVSLNNLLMVGPVIQNDLFSILIRFRYPKYVFSADIAKMYRQIQVDEDDTHFQYIFWRNNLSERLQIYRLTTVTYRTASAPYIATRCLKQLTIDEGKIYPLAATIVNTSVYVDAWLGSTI